MTSRVTFADLLRTGDAARGDVDDWVETWHLSGGKNAAGEEVGLRQHLGMTVEQYWCWLIVGDELLDEIVDGDYGR